MISWRLDYSRLFGNPTWLRFTILCGVATLSSLSLLVPRNLFEQISGGGEGGGMNPLCFKILLARGLLQSKRLRSSSARASSAE
jgi:hypothetical protein